MILAAEKLNKSFGGLMAVKDVDLQIEEKELSSIIGPNGAGKTTLFDLLTGHIPLDSGKVIFKENDITKFSPHEICRAGVGRSFQRLNIFPKLSTFDNVQVAVFSANGKGSNLFSQAEKMLQEDVEDILESIGLHDKKDNQGGLLAHGDQKRLELGIALACQPKLLLLDEPTAGMSPKETLQTAELIQKLTRERGLTLVFVEHDMSVVFDISDKIRVMHQGSILFEGEPEEVRANDEVQKIYLGEDKA